MTNSDPLQTLVLDDREFARDELASVLRPYVRFTPNGQLILEERFGDLNSLEKLCCVLLAYRAMHMVGLRDGAGVLAVEVEAETGLPGGTIRPKLSQLRKVRIAAQNGKHWLIPTYSVRRAAAMIRGDA